MKNSTTDKSNIGFSKLRKQIELIGIDVKNLNEQAGPWRFQLKTNVINQHFTNELDKIGLQLINIRATWIGRQRKKSVEILLDHIAKNTRLGIDGKLRTSRWY
jgi:hypothetical protein